MLDPQVQAHLDRLKAMGAMDIADAGVRLARQGNHLETDIAGSVNTECEITNFYINTETADLHAQIFIPKNLKGKKNLPAMLYFHGGGWVVNFITKYEGPLSDIAVKAGIVIISINYQKAPEHKFPIPFDDCYTLLTWTLENAEKLGIDVNKIGVCGDSAGGNLASAVAIAARDRGVAIAFQVLIYPCNGPQYVANPDVPNAQGFGLSQRGMKWLWELYLKPGDENNPYAVPHSAKDLSKLAPALVLTAEYDVLRIDGLEYAKKLEAAGVPTKQIDYPGMIHGFFSLGKYIDAAQTIRKDIVDWIKATI